MADAEKEDRNAKIFAAYEAGARVCDLAKEHGLSRGRISHIVDRQRRIISNGVRLCLKRKYGAERNLRCSLAAGHAGAHVYKEVA